MKDETHDSRRSPLAFRVPGQHGADHVVLRLRRTRSAEEDRHPGLKCWSRLALLGRRINEERRRDDSQAGLAPRAARYLASMAHLPCLPPILRGDDRGANDLSRAYNRSVSRQQRTTSVSLCPRWIPNMMQGDGRRGAGVRQAPSSVQQGSASAATEIERGTA